MKIKYKYSLIRKNIDVILKIDNKKVIFKNISETSIEKLSDILATDHCVIDYWDCIMINGFVWDINIFGDGDNQDNSILTISLYDKGIDDECISFPIRMTYSEIDI